MAAERMTIGSGNGCACRPPGRPLGSRGGQPTCFAALAVGALLLAACAGEAGRGFRSTPPPPRPLPSAPLAETTPRGIAAFLGPVRTIAANGIRIGYRQFGEGRPLLLLTGQTGTMSLWEYGLMRKLADAGFRVTMFDNRGMGYSTDDGTELLTLGLMARDTVALMDALGLEKPTLVGWSMGGEISLTLAVDHGEKVGTILTCGSTAGSPHAVDGPPQIYADLANPDLPPEKLIGYVFPPTAQVAVAAFVASIDLYPPEVVSPAAVKAQAQAEDAFSKDDGLWNALPRIKNKVILTNGSEDVVVPSANARLVGARIPGAVVEIFDGAGHAALMQDPDRFVALVEKHA